MFTVYVFIIRVANTKCHLPRNDNRRIIQPGVRGISRNGTDAHVSDTTLLSMNHGVATEPIRPDPFGISSVPSIPINTPQVRGHEFKTTGIIIVLLFLFVLLTTPYFVITLVTSMGHWEPHAHPYFLHIISVLLFHTNSACNALLYGYSNQRLRNSLINYLRKKIQRQKRTQSDTVTSQWLPNSRLSVMGDGSSVEYSQGSSHNSNISSLSAFSRDAFISRDILSVFTNYNTQNTMLSPSFSEHLLETPIL